MTRLQAKWLLFLASWGKFKYHGPAHQMPDIPMGRIRYKNTGQLGDKMPLGNAANLAPQVGGQVKYVYYKDKVGTLYK